MSTTALRTAARRVAAAAVAAACSAAPRATPADVRAPATPAPAAAPDPASTGAAADARFMRRMIPHHAQALAMTALVPARTTREDVRLLAERIALSQESEIAAMRRWLEERGERPPEPDAPAGHHGAAAEAMPGMLSPEELARLSAATGAEFDRLFVDYMIRHHEGALAMVAELFATPGAAQETAVYRLAAEIDADQRAEIRRLRALRDASPAGAPPR